MAWMKRFGSVDNDLAITDFTSTSRRREMTSTPLQKRSASANHLDFSDENLADIRAQPQFDFPRGSCVPGYETGRYKSPARGRHDNGRSGRYAASNSGYVSDSGTTTSSRYRSNPNSGDELELASSSRHSSTHDLHKKTGSSSVLGATERRVSADSRGNDRYRKERKTSEPKRHESWAYIDGYSDAPPPIHTSASYGEFEGTSSTSGSLFIPRVRTVHSAPPSAIDTTERRKVRNKRGDSSLETYTSGYSTNSLSEMSEFTSVSQSGKEQNRKYKQNPAHRKTNVDGDRSRDHERTYSDSELRYGQRTSKEEKHNAINSSHKRSESKLSINESEVSGSSKDRSRKHNDRDRKGSSTSLDSKVHIDSKNSSQKELTSIGNVSVTVTNNIRYDPNDPFSFIQPVDLPFHLKVKKCAGPIMAVLLLIILAGALGAAIFFASAWSDKQDLEAKVDLLQANLAVKIRNSGYTENIDNLSTAEFKDVSSNYCKQMDLFYTKSKFQKTYRGCEVISIKDRSINFTLFFVEKEATTSQIIAVIETSATRVENDTASVAVVDKFELELDTVKVTIERRTEPETFNRKLAVATTTTTAAPTSILIPRLKDTTVKKTTISVVTSPDQNKPFVKKKASTDKPVYLWDPCQHYEGDYFPHPTKCDMYFQCSNGESILQQCSKELLYHWKELTCISKYTKVECPDASKAPPRPTTTTAKPTETTTMLEETTTETISFTMDDDMMPLKKTTSGPGTESLTAIAGKYKGRTVYKSDPCKLGADGKLYPHPDDCGKFIQCVNGKEMHMDCSPKLVFDPADSTCIFPPNKNLICPDIHPCKGLNEGYFPHPYDCSQFIQCQSGREQVLTCPNNLVWIETVKSCVHNTVGDKCPPVVRE